MKIFLLNCLFGLIGGLGIIGVIYLVILFNEIVPWAFGVLILWLLYILGSTLRDLWENKK